MSSRDVSIHAPAWGATSPTSSCSWRRTTFQSTHPRGVRRAMRTNRYRRFFVSIHAPAWGATSSRRPPRRNMAGFNPRTRVGCDDRRAGSRGRDAGFNPRTRVGCDGTRDCVALWYIRFNPRTRVGCDSSLIISFRPPISFQSTHPRGVRPSPPGAVCRTSLFQSTHPRGVRLFSLPCKRLVEEVSIHAPAWGATLSGCGTIWVSGVSIHAPAWGATSPTSSCSWRRTTFQSTHPRGVRRAMRTNRYRRFFVSIHAPAWGATSSRRPPRRNMAGFNPRTRVGCDDRRAGSRGRDAGFNPRTRVGCDGTRDCVALWYIRFNPRTRVGCDSSLIISFRPPISFQSTHPRGVRPSPPGAVCRTSLFQSTHPRGVRLFSLPCKRLVEEVSIHAPAWGATLSGCGTIWVSGVSIHAPAWGATTIMTVIT